MKEIRTKIGQLHLYDLVKGAFIAAAAAPLETLMEYLDKGELPLGVDWKRVGFTFVAAFLAYIIKQFLTGSSGKILINKKQTTMSNTAYQIRSYNDIEQISGLSIVAFCAANPQYTMQDGTDNLPNLCIATGGGQPVMNFFDVANNNEPYGCDPVEYVGTRPPGR